LIDGISLPLRFINKTNTLYFLADLEMAFLLASNMTEYICTTNTPLYTFIKDINSYFNVFKIRNDITLYLIKKNCIFDASYRYLREWRVFRLRKQQ